MNQLAFKINSRLAILLSQNYRSTEAALKELVDNAWDADAAYVNISLPQPMSSDPILIEDNGSGMTEQELSTEYLSVASNRRTLRGELTPGKKRQVKGRKGIGKFAGLLAAASMQVITWASGKRSTMEFNINKLEQFNELSTIPIPVNTIEDLSQTSGTRITLTGLYQHINFPCPIKLRQLLIQEYGRETDFLINIDGKPLDSDDIQGLHTDIKENVMDLGDVKLKFTISDQKSGIRMPGIAIRVDGKIIGEPSFFGLDEMDSFPPKLLKKIYGEVEVDGLIDDVTADWGAILQNSEKYKILQKTIQPILEEKFKEVYGREINLAKARLHKDVQARLAALPEYKREYADKAIKKILDRFYQESPKKVSPIVNVLLDAIERSDYRTVLEHIDEAKHSEVALFAEALSNFGLFEMSKMIEQANNRLEFLNEFDSLCLASDTLEKDVHKAMESNLWMLGSNYSLFSSNQTLKTLIKNVLDEKYIGSRANKRPDLLLGENIQADYLLIEFKKPSHTLTYEDYQQATAYRNDFRHHTANQKIDVWLLGGKKGGTLPVSQDAEQNSHIILYTDLISTARRQLDWLLKELKT